MLFIHDHTFIYKDGKYYTTGSLNQMVMDRYKTWFGRCSVFATMRNAGTKDFVFIKEENQVRNLEFNLVPKKNSIKYLISIRKPIEEAVKKADCVVARMSIFGAIGIHYAKKHYVPYLVEMVACPWDSLWYHSTKGKILAPLMTLLTKNVCKKAPYVLYVTNEFLQRRYPTKGIAIGCSDVELTNFDETVFEKRLERIKKTDIKTCKLKLCTVANIAVKYKGQDIVINSLKNLADAGIDCEYFLIGGGDRTRLKGIAEKAGVADRVHIIGPIPHEAVFGYLNQMDVYVQPSNQEGLPRAVIEAMSQGCPVVGSTTGGIPELINGEVVFKKGSVEDFTRVMQSLTMEKMLCYARENYKNSFKYEAKHLNEKRTNFYLTFAKVLKKR